MPQRVALLVATYRYEDAGLSQLTAPGYDAETLAEVLRHPEIANFDVTILVNEPHYVVGKVVGEFYRNRRRDDLTLLYFTGHGLKDDEGRLYFAMTNTTRDDLLFTALSAQQIDYAMNSCSSRQKVLILDCCYSGAFPVDCISKADTEVHTLEKFQGKGRVVLTASDSTQYSFEGNYIAGQGTQSVFTRFLVEGLSTGEADLDGDGDISLDELYSYVHDRVIDEMPQQRPKKQENVEGRIVIARNIHWRLPVYVRNAIESKFVQDRLTALEILAHLHRGGNDLVRGEVIDQTRRLVHDDSKPVSAAAMELMTTLNPEQARQEVEKKEEKKTVTSQSLLLPVDDMTTSSVQLDLEAKASFHPQPGVAAKKQTTLGTRDRAEESAQRKADRWITSSSWSKPAPQSDQERARLEAQGQNVMAMEDGEHLRLTHSWGLSRLTRRPQLVLTASAALVVTPLVVVLVGGVTTLFAPTIPAASPPSTTTPAPLPAASPPSTTAPAPLPAASPPSTTAPAPLPAASPRSTTAPAPLPAASPRSRTAPPPSQAAPPPSQAAPPPSQAAPPPPTTTTTPHRHNSCYPFCDEPVPDDGASR